MTDTAKEAGMLLPCPFCGCEPTIATPCTEPKIYCASDECMGPHTTAANLQDATVQWNTRAALPHGAIMNTGEKAAAAAAQSKAEQDARARLANNGRNPANKNADIRVGSDLHLCEMLLGELDGARAKVAALPHLQAQEWEDISTAPKDERVLLYNELWDETFGEQQIGRLENGSWLFDGEMNIDDMDDIVGDDSGLSAVDYQPRKWRPLPAPPSPPAPCCRKERGKLMGPVRTPYMGGYESLIRAMESERNTFAAGNVLDRAREVIENWKKQHDAIRQLLDPHGINKDKPIATLVADAVALERAALSSHQCGGQP